MRAQPLHRTAVPRGDQCRVKRAQIVVVGRVSLDGALSTTVSIKRKRKKSMEHPSVPHSKYDLNKLYQFIVRYKVACDGNSPTYNDIMRACRISSKSLVQRRLKRLAVEGRIRLSSEGTARSIVVVGGTWIAPTQASK